MTTFDDREKGFEAKFRHDEETAFKIRARRNKLLGEWLAAQMGLSGEEVAAYAREVVEADFERPGDDDVVEKVLRDLEARGMPMSEHRLRREMDRLLEEARKQILAEAKPSTPEAI